ncbi:amino acid permease [Staphylococcus gallinarum]|uniref:amino acid permease n=1 Tax=Staphylococcus gallinarum TaxID=1293 RepID=UPI000D1DD59E|nr:amino acid permease [Staphylococcus gallinarum]MCD8787092.1 amino acid permease [Staphylococcus gallinarum]MCD8843857.1 amino acid permease [Staphylococcus gallinarum]MCD8860035.1 amino acid permease [Staphylococcus gallinarum]PTL16824.1 gamma-aminobutyrate permease [Staphylococcus gallinarum]RIO80387.1 amino acid permease [Staphylococcus gallinarum]
MSNSLSRELSNRHIQLIAIGGAIGTGLFLGAGQSISLTGPSILLTYIIVGFVLFMFMRAMGELLLANTEYKTFADIAHDQISPLAGFITGWTYWLTWITSGMAEITAVAKYVEYWVPDLPNWITSLACILLLMAFNLTSTKMFGELEFWFAIIKVLTIVALIVVGIVMIVFAVKTPFGHTGLGNMVTKEGFFPNGANGFLMSFQMVVFSFTGIEILGITAGETKNPEKTIPKAINSVPIRILLFYVGSLVVMMSIIPWQNIKADDSPFVSLFALIGVPFAAGLINFVLLTAASSACNSGIFANSRILFGLSEKEQTHPLMMKTNKRGVPYIAIIVTCILLSVTVIMNYFIPNATQVFFYVTAISTILLIIVWMFIMHAYAMYTKRNPNAHKESIYKLPGGLHAARLVQLFFVFVLVVLFIMPDTRMGVVLSPIWFIILGILYWRLQKSNESRASKQNIQLPNKENG